MFHASSLNDESVHTCITVDFVRITISTTARCATVFTRASPHGETGAYSDIVKAASDARDAAEVLTELPPSTALRSLLARNIRRPRCMAPRIVHLQNRRIVSGVVGI